MTKRRNALTIRDRLAVSYWKIHFWVKGCCQDFYWWWFFGEHPSADKDYCVCGDLVECHTIGSGHSPVRQTDYYNRPPIWRRIFGRKTNV